MSDHLTRIMAIDPGTTKSGWVTWDSERRSVAEYAIYDNQNLLNKLHTFVYADFIAIEMISSYGMPVGREVFSTCLWIGRFMEAARKPVRLIYRKDVKMHLCQTARAKDANIRTALIEKLGAPGTKKSPGPTYGISGHLWSALAVAIYAGENP